MVWVSPAEEEELFSRYRFAVEMGEWGPYEALTPTQKLTIWLRQLRGGGAMWVSNCLLVWSILTYVMVKVCLIKRFAFQPTRRICTSDLLLGGYCRVKVH